MTATLRKLANRMVRSRTIAFVGAGARASVGYPTWNQLLDGLYREVASSRGLRRPESDQDLRWIAEQFDRDLEGTLMDAVRRVFEHHSPSGPGPVHTMLVRLPFNHYITTNYDRLIEQACDIELSRVENTRAPIPDSIVVEPCISRSGRDQEQFSNFLSIMAEDSPRRAVLHLHGTLEDQLTLTMADYNSQYLHDAILLRMFAIFATSTVVFVGASLQDPDVMELVRRAHFHSGPKPRHFAFLPDFRAGDAGILERNYGIQPIFYRYDTVDGHSDVVRRLEQLLELVERRIDYPASLQANANIGSTAELLVPDAPSEFEDMVDRVKDQVRRERRGLATFSGLDRVTNSRILRRIATDYSQLPGDHHFRNVVMLSPGVLGRFPGASCSRSLLDALVGELASALGSYRVTAVPRHEQTLRAIESLLQRSDARGAESALLVIDGIDELKDSCHPDELSLMRRFLQNLPQGTVAVLAQDGDADPFDDQQRWEGIKSHVFFDPAPGRNSDAIPNLGPDDRVINGLAGDEVMQRTLLGVCILAGPVRAEVLASMLDLPPGEVEGAAADLCEAGIVEVEHLPEPAPTGTFQRARERIPVQGLGEIGVNTPMRTAALRECQQLSDAETRSGGEDVLSDVVRRLLSWSRFSISSLDRWESDTNQFLELTSQLADFLAVFEAGCWLDGMQALGGPPPEGRGVDTWLWLGADLAYILPYAGRWAEAKRILHYLEKEIEKASRPRVFQRELQILESRIVGHLAVDDHEYLEAADLARSAMESAQEELERLNSASTLADRTAVELHRTRAAIRLGQALTYQGSYEPAREVFGSVYETAFTESGNRPSGRPLKYAADAAGWLADAMRWELPENPSHDQVTEILRVLDDGFTALVELANKRDRGHQAVLRGEVLQAAANNLAARRSLARALVVSHEFRDRYLEARALFGLARTDGRRALAEKSADIFADFAPEWQRMAKDLWYELPPVEPEPSPGSSRRPSLVVFVGLPGSGKTAALRAAVLALTSWGLIPEVEPFSPGLTEQMRAGINPDIEELRERFEKRIENYHRTSGKVALATVPLSHPGEVFGHDDWEDPLLSEILCLHIEAPLDVLEARNRELHAEGVDYATLAEFARRQSRAEIPSPHATWESWVEVRGGSYVHLRSDVPIRTFQDSVRESLALSYLETERLVNHDW
jgi:tetratricopeptide (TPR) repeat protein